MAATNQEILALVDAYTATSRSVRQSSNRLENAREAKANAETLVAQRKTELEAAEAIMRQARQELDAAIETRAV